MGKSRTEKKDGDEDALKDLEKGKGGGGKGRKPGASTKNITDSLSEGSTDKGTKKPRTRKVK